MRELRPIFFPPLYASSVFRTGACVLGESALINLRTNERNEGGQICSTIGEPSFWSLATVAGITPLPSPRVELSRR